SIWRLEPMKNPNVNVANIDTMIAEISKQQDRPVKMSSFVDKNVCGTTACLAGWPNFIRLNTSGSGFTEYDTGVDNTNKEFDEKYEILMELDDTGAAAEWMGISEEYAGHLFYTMAADALSPAQEKEAAIRMLTLIRTGAEPNWSDVLKEF